MKKILPTALIVATLWSLILAPLPLQAEASGAYDFEKARQHWSFQSPQRKEAGKLENPAWTTKPLDAFVLARLEDANLTPNPPADDRALKRRVSFDLIGLPPDPGKIKEDSYEEFVEQMLTSPHFGERVWD